MLRAFVWVIPIHAPKLGFGAIRPPKWGAVSAQPSKVTSLLWPLAYRMACMTVLAWCICTQIKKRMWPIVITCLLETEGLLKETVSCVCCSATISQTVQDRDVISANYMYYIQGAPKNLAQCFCMALLYQILTNSRNCFTVRFKRKFAIMLSLKDATTPQVCWSEMSLSGTNYRSVSLISPLVSGVTGLNAHLVLNLRSDISQGSVATPLRCGWIFSDGIISDFLVILLVK